MVIPLSGVGHQRVTHPFATLTFRRVQRFPFDLHALGTPLAFILSQDQTLRRKFFPYSDLIFRNCWVQAVACFYHFSVVKVPEWQLYQPITLCQDHLLSSSNRTSILYVRLLNLVVPLSLLSETGAYYIYRLPSVKHYTQKFILSVGLWSIVAPYNSSVLLATPIYASLSMDFPHIWRKSTLFWLGVAVFLCYLIMSYS